MNDIKVYVHLASNSPFTIRVNGDDTIRNWVVSLLKDDGLDAQIERYVIAKNNTIALSPDKTFYEAGFRNGDQLNINKSNQTIEDKGNFITNIPDEYRDNATKPGESLVEKSVQSDEPIKKEVLNVLNENTKGSNKIQDKKPVGAGIIIAALFLIVFVVGLYYLSNNFSKGNENTIQNHDATAKIDQPLPNPMAVSTVPNNTNRVNNIPKNETIIKPPRPDKLADTTSHSVEGYFRKLADPNISDKQKVLLKSNLLNLFTSPDVPVIKMKSGKATNTGTTIGNYVESVYLLGTKVIISNSEKSNGKISKLYVTEN